MKKRWYLLLIAAGLLLCAVPLQSPQHLPKPVFALLAAGGSVLVGGSLGSLLSYPVYRRKTASSPFTRSLFSPGRRSRFLGSAIYHRRFSTFGLFDARVISSLMRRVSFLCTRRLISRTFSVFTETS